MTTLEQARAKLAELGRKGLITLGDKSLTPAAQKAALDKLDREIKHWQDEATSLEYVDGRRRQLLGDGDFAGENGGPLGYRGALGQAPPVMPTDPQFRELFDAARSRKSLRIEVGTKAATDVGQPAVRVGPPLGLNREPTRVLDYVPSTATGAPVVEYVRIDSISGAATVVAPGTAKPELTPTITRPTLTIPKIAAIMRVTDETLEDYQTFATFVASELQRSVVDAENNELLNSTTSGAQGLNVVSGTLTRDKGTDTALDAVELALNDLRTGPAFAVADLIIAHPDDFSALRREKDTQGRYLLSADPSAAEASSLWGINVLQTTQQPAGTVIAGAFATSVVAYVRQGLFVDTASSGDDWTANISAFRCEERVGLAVTRPAGLIKVDLAA